MKSAKTVKRRELRIGVIGTGGRGRLAQHAHKPGQGSRVVACCDINPAALEWARSANGYGADTYVTRDYRDLLRQELDAVFVCSRDFLHEEHALAALQTGCAVYLEKPMAISVKGCDRILRAAQRHRARLFVGHNMRYMTIIRKMKHLIDTGAIGDVKAVWCRHFISYGGDAYFRDWHAERRYSNGLLLQKGAHDIDVMHWLSGSRTRRVSAFGQLSVYNRCHRDPASSARGPRQLDLRNWTTKHWPPLKVEHLNPRIDVEDQNVVIMEMENGVLGSYLQCHFAPDCCRNYTVIGTAGRLENLGDGPTDPIMLWNKRSDAYRLIGDEVHYGGAAAGGHGGADPVIVDEFLTHVRKGIRTTATPQAARYSVVTGCLATFSLRHGGRPQQVPPLPADLERHRF